MDVNLTTKVDAIQNLYIGTATFMDITDNEKRKSIIQIPIIAINSEEAKNKLKAYISQELPHTDLSKCQLTTKPELCVI